MILAEPRLTASFNRSAFIFNFFIDLANTLKAFIGLNFMVVAYAFSKAGMVRGIIGLVVITVVTEHCCNLLVDIKDSFYEPISTDNLDIDNYPSSPSVSSSQDESNSNEYNDEMDGIPESAGQRPPTYGDVAFRVGGKTAESIINAALILTQFGYCVSYLIFISQTMHDVVASTAPVPLFILFPLPVVGGLGLLVSIRSLGPFSVFANGALLCGFGAVVTFIVNHFHWSLAHVPITSFPLFFGQMTAALEGIGLVIPLQSSMQNRNHFPVVLRIALCTLTAIMMAVGVLGFATFGADTRSIILLNFGQSPIVVIVKSVLILGILFTYPLQIIPVYEFAERRILSMHLNESHQGELANNQYEHPDIDSEFRIADEEGNDEDSANNGNDHLAHEVINGVENNDVTFANHASNEAEFDQIDIENNLPIENNRNRAQENSPVHSGNGQEGVFLRDGRRIAVRLGVVASTALIAVLAGASFGVFQALVGSTGASVLAYTAPAIFHNMAFKNRLTRAAKMKNIVIAVFGVLGAIVGTFSSVWEIVQIHRGNAVPT